MIWIWIAQLALDVGLILTVLTMWRAERRKAASDPSYEERMAAALNVLETRALQLEKEIQHYRKNAQEQLTRLIQISEQAQAILARGQARITPFAPTLEELEFRQPAPAKELEALAAAPVAEPAEKIPTLQELEDTRARHRSDLQLDLKAILRDQLA